MDITNIVMFLLGGTVLGVAVTLGIQWFLKWKEGTGEIPQELIEALVEVAEKMYMGQGRGKEKLAYVIGFLHAEAEKLNIEFDEDAVVEIINAYVEEVFNSTHENDEDFYSVNNEV